VLDDKYNTTKKQQETEKQELNKKLAKIEQKWNEYVANANKIGIDPTVFCNQTCSHD